MKIGFYSPLKSPDHAVPSGDRAMARALIGVLASLGHDVETLCRLRSYDRQGSPARQAKMRRLGARIAERIVERDEPKQMIFTYHCYHKAPDWIGPALAARWNIPYVIVEASIAGKQAGGPWDIGHKAVIDAVRRADHVFAMTDIDTQGLASFVRGVHALSILKPFVDVPVVLPTRPTARPPRLLTVAMMRDDVKRRSYELLAATLVELLDLDWTIEIVGDGPAAPAIHAMFEPVADRTVFRGALARAELAESYRAADMFVWPGLREAYGMVYLEAQSFGLPVVAVGDGGVAEIVRDGQTGLLSCEPTASALAQRLRLLLTDPGRLQSIGAQAREHVIHAHSTTRARQTIDRVLQRLVRH